jgi:hypothetical protein
MLSTLKIAGITGVASLLIGGGIGWQTRSWKADSDALEAKAKAEEAFLLATKQGYDAGMATASREQSIITVAGGSQTQARIIYRDKVVPAQCDVLDAGKRLLDEGTAATGAAPAEPSAAMPSSAE